METTLKRHQSTITTHKVPRPRWLFAHIVFDFCQRDFERPEQQKANLLLGMNFITECRRQLPFLLAPLERTCIVLAMVQKEKFLHN